MDQEQEIRNATTELQMELPGRKFSLCTIPEHDDARPLPLQFGSGLQKTKAATFGDNNGGGQDGHGREAWPALPEHPPRAKWRRSSYQAELVLAVTDVFPSSTTVSRYGFLDQGGIRGQNAMGLHTGRCLGEVVDSSAKRVSSPSRRRSFATLSRHLSMTPGYIPHPPDVFDSSNGHSKAEEFLGLRSRSSPPPVPPKQPRSRHAETVKQVDWWDGESQSGDHGEHYSEARLNGRIAWLHALTGFLVIFTCWGLSNSFGVLQAYFQRNYLSNTTSSTVAWIGSTQLALVFGLGVPIGRLVDKGHFRLCFHGGSAVLVMGILASSWCHTWATIWLTQGLLVGIGMGMVFCSGIVALMTWFDETRMGAAMALGAAGSCVGGIIYVLLLRHFLRTNGYATTMRILSGVAALTMLPANLVYRVRGQSNGRQAQYQKPILQEQRVSLRDFLGTSYLLAGAGLFFSFLGLYFGFVYIILYASSELRLSDTAATNLLIFMLAANLPGRFLPALISDKCIGPLNTTIPATLLSGACIWLWAASSANRVSLTVLACFYGFASAGIQVLYAPIIHSLCSEPSSALLVHTKVANGSSVSAADSREEQKRRSAAKRRMGIKAGGIFTVIGIAALIGTPIGGALISYRQTRGLNRPYLGAQCFAGASLMIGGALLLASRVARVGWGPQRA